MKASRSIKSVILMYHRVTKIDYDPWFLAVSPRKFLMQMKHLKSHYKILSLNSLAVALKQGKLPTKSIVITFDDGYRDNYLNAKPVLEKLRIPATFFITTYHCSSNTPFWWDRLAKVFDPRFILPKKLSITLKGKTFSWKIESPETKSYAFYSIHKLLKPLSQSAIDSAVRSIEQWAHSSLKEQMMENDSQAMNTEELRELAQNALFTIGAHTHRHGELGSRSPSLQRSAIVKGKQYLEKTLKMPVKHFAYPYGSYNSDTIRIINDCCFDTACTTQSRALTTSSNLYELPRYQVLNWQQKIFENIVNQLLS